MVMAGAGRKPNYFCRLVQMTLLVLRSNPSPPSQTHSSILAISSSILRTNTEKFCALEKWSTKSSVSSSCSSWLCKRRVAPTLWWFHFSRRGSKEFHRKSPSVEEVFLRLLCLDSLRIKHTWKKIPSTLLFSHQAFEWRLDLVFPVFWRGRGARIAAFAQKHGWTFTHIVLVESPGEIGLCILCSSMALGNEERERVGWASLTNLEGTQRSCLWSIYYI